MKRKGEGEPATAKIIKEITDRDSRLADQPERKRFLASVYDDEFQEVVTHNEILDHITQQEETKDDKISTGLALDSLHKIRVSCVENHVSARSDAQICFLS